MCIDFTGLNKARPKYSYPLPNIDHLVDNTSGFGMLGFGDAFTKYNQLKMHPKDEDKTAFITSKRVYYYRVMSFGLKNATAISQRMMNKVFTEQIRRNMKVYVDDILVKLEDP